MKRIAFLGLLVASSNAMAGDFALGLDAGTFGAGISVTYDVSDKINLRGLIHGGEFSAPDFEADGVDYTGDIELGGQALLVDFFPLGGKFRFTAGIINNTSELQARATAASISVGDEGDTLQNGSAEIDLEIADGIVPYFGIGWGNAVSDGIPLGFGIDIGVIPADPEIRFALLSGQYTDASSGTTADVNDPSIRPAVDGAIQQEITRINNEDLDDITFYPIVNLSLSYRF